MAKDPLKKYVVWARNNPGKGLLTGLAFLVVCVGLFTLQAYRSVENQDPGARSPILMLVPILGMMTGLVLIGAALYGAYHSGNRPVGFSLGLMFIAAGIGIIIWSFPKLQEWAGHLEGSAVKTGPIVVPGVVLVIVVPLIAAAIALKGGQMVMKAVKR